MIFLYSRKFELLCNGGRNLFTFNVNLRGYFLGRELRLDWKLPIFLTLPYDVAAGFKRESIPSREPFLQLF